MSEQPSRSFSRKAFLGAAGGLMAGAVVHTRADAVDLLAASPPAQQVPDPTKVHGPPPSPLGRRAPAEQPRRLATRPGTSGASTTPLQDLDGIITPADLHFERHHAGVPAIDPDTYTLLIHGMVERPTVYTLRDLKRFPTVSRIAFLECSGNGWSGYTRDPNPRTTPQQAEGLTSTSEWIGVPLSTLFREVGVRPSATWFVAEGGDAALLARSVPIQKGWEDAMIAYGQNGEAIRPEQGYPARLFLPGWEGNANVKWIRRIEVTDAPLMARDETSKYTDVMADGRSRQFSFVMDAKSIITFPAYPYALPERGWWEIRGIAWTGRGMITRVEVSMDGGRTWERAQLQEPVLTMCHTRFRHLWNWNGRETVLMSRAIDETGYVQPSTSALIGARGEGSFYHSNNIRAWHVANDGTVTFAPGDPA